MATEYKFDCKFCGESFISEPAPDYWDAAVETCPHCKKEREYSIPEDVIATA